MNLLYIWVSLLVFTFGITDDKAQKELLPYFSPKDCGILELLSLILSLYKIFDP